MWWGEVHARQDGLSKQFTMAARLMLAAYFAKLHNRLFSNRPQLAERIRRSVIGCLRLLDRRSPSKLKHAKSRTDDPAAFLMRLTIRDFHVTWKDRPPKDSIGRAAYYRQKADECRRMAEHVAFIVARPSFLSLAQSYEALAAQAETLLRSPRNDRLHHDLGRSVL
jgi:hypothetical protein